jgi:hypothetical protein
MQDDDTMTDDDRNREHLRQHPAQELSLWMDWVLTVCRWNHLEPPTVREWYSLTATWHHDKKPVTSVDELVAMRGATR